jgi:N-acyl-D-amino-acid deacylase
MAAVEAARARGAAVWPQVQTRPIDISFTLDQRSLMLLTMPAWWKVASIRDHAEKLAAVADRRQALVDEMNAWRSGPTAVSVPAASWCARSCTSATAT